MPLNPLSRALTGVKFPNGEHFPAATPEGVTVGLDAQTVAARTGGPISGGLYHVANTVYAHIALGDAAVDADVTSMLLAPGERPLVIPDGVFASVIKSTGEPDGIVRMTRMI
ncbi:hypothetical protein [Roseibium aggregatum]|uniref:Uncharacterized protein n=1 Tax=Roseibium aggregatum TaxID=187304 RepID=A0A0M6Y6M7_9HYPH|nr:hypothetical protein [Roseibium aggregatum]CTQ45755.1 hypothetical protein LAL4801_04210 [Roseibium aggregatum]